jgi:hypothetical protein
MYPPTNLFQLEREVAVIRQNHIRGLRDAGIRAFT